MKHRAYVSRVNIAYKVENNGSKEKVALPFVIGIIAELSDIESDNFIIVDKNNFNKLFTLLSPKITLFFENKEINLKFLSINDFNPINILNQINFATSILQNRALISDFMYKLQGNKKLIAALSHLNKGLFKNEALEIGINTNFIKNEKETQKIKFLQFFSENIKVKKDPYHICIDIVADIDKGLAILLNYILSDTQFRLLEKNWRSIYNLFSSIQHEQIIFKVFNTTTEKLKIDVELGYEQSNLFQLIYENEYGTIGGTPFSCILLDYFFTKEEDDIKLIQELALLCEKAHAPLIAAASPDLFGIESFDKLYAIDLKNTFLNSEYIQWNELRKKEEMRYINLCLPQVLIRQPYKISSGFIYEEAIKTTSDLCFGNAAYSMALCVIRAFNKYHWTAAIRGHNGGGLVDNMPFYIHRIDNQPEIICPVDIHITDRKEKELSDLGFIPLCHKKMTNQAIFFSAQSLQKPKEYDDDNASGNALIASRLPYMLNASRFAHYLKIMMRDNIGTFQSAEQLQNELQNWIGQYVLLVDNVNNETLKAEYPLREAKITVVESMVGDYDVKIHIRPHFQLESINVTLGFVVKIIE